MGPPSSDVAGLRSVGRTGEGQGPTCVLPRKKVVSYLLKRVSSDDTFRVGGAAPA